MDKLIASLLFGVTALASTPPVVSNLGRPAKPPTAALAAVGGRPLTLLASDQERRPSQSKEDVAGAAQEPASTTSTAINPTDPDSGEIKLYAIGGAVSAPILIHSAQPKLSREQRKSKLSGDVVVKFILDTSGVPSHARVTHGVESGLDQKALEAVSGYRFRPATMNGKPVPVELNVQVRFQPS